MPASLQHAAFWRTAGLLLWLVSSAGCGDEDPTDPEDPVTGIVQVAVSTSGPDPDPDGYLAALDGGGSALPLPISGSTSFPDVTAGEHTVALSGLAANCTVDAASKSVTVVAGATATVSFTVSCSAISVPPTVGSIRVVTSTIGSNPDPDGYGFAIDDGPAQAIPTTSTATINDVAPGTHRVVLSGVATNCGLTGGRSKEVTVRAGVMADAVFTVTCYVMGPSPSPSSVQVDPASITIGYPSMIHLPMSIITVTVLDANATPLPGMEVTVNATGSGNSIGPWPSAESSITNANGVATFNFSSSMPEPKTITARANGVLLGDSPVITVVKSFSNVFITGVEPEPSMAGEPFVVRVGISGVNGISPQGGTVSVRSNLEPVAGCDAAPVGPPGPATCEMTLSVVSTHMLTATYSGDIQFEGGTSTGLEHVVIAP